MSARSPGRSGRRAASRAPRDEAPEPPSAPPLRHPALLATALAAAVLVTLAVTHRLTSPDVWQHLLVGRVMWETGRIPFEHQWTWPSFGRPEVLNSWGFRWLLWPFWAAGDVVGLQVWRWLTTLGAFGLAWAGARRLGARGFVPLVVVAVAALSYRARSQVRPETLVAVLLALQILVLERRRARGGGALALVALACAWANVHLSYYLGVVLIAIHLTARPAAADAPHHAAPASAGDAVRSPAASAPALLRRLDHMPGPALLACAVAASFANPFGWRALWQPFEYFLVWRHEPVYRTISELVPLTANWRSTLPSGLPVLIVLWPLLVAWRAARRRFDPAEALTCAVFTALTVFNSRFAGFYVIVVVPYLSRGLSEICSFLPAPAALRGAWPRAGIAVAAMALASLPSWSDLRYRPGIGTVPTLVPERACDFIAAHGISGRMFNPFYFGGYVAWRFWPDRGRLPFMDIHQSGTRRDRELYTYAFANPDAWRELERAHDFRVALLDGHPEWVAGDRLLDRLDADPGWALVFRDDAAALYLRRDGPFAGVVDSFAYRVAPGGEEGFVRLGQEVRGDTLRRRALRAELERRVRDSPLNAQAHSHLANLAFLEGSREGARFHLEAALDVEPRMVGLHRRLGYLEMARERWREAIREFEAERRIGAPPEDEYVRMGMAWERLSDRRRAIGAYRRHLDFHPDDARVREILGRLSIVD